MFKFWTVFAVLRVEINERVSIMKRMRQRMLYIVRNICSIDRIFELAKMKFDDKKKKRLIWIVKFYLNIKLNESIDWACSHLELVVHWLKVSKSYKMNMNWRPYLKFYFGNTDQDKAINVQQTASFSLYVFWMKWPT